MPDHVITFGVEIPSLKSHTVTHTELPRPVTLGAKIPRKDPTRGTSDIELVVAIRHLDILRDVI